MKKYILIPVILFCFIGLSCSDFLDKDLLGKETSENFFNSEDNAESAVIAIYNKVYKGGAFPDWWWSNEAWEFYMGDMCSDDAEKGSTEGDFQSLTQIENWSVSSNEGIIKSIYGNPYIGIARANFVLDNIDAGTNISDRKKVQSKGEAMFLKGWFYFYLLRHFGPVPIFEKSVQPSDFGNIGRGTIHETFKHIEKNLRGAIDLLPEKSEYPSADMGRATKGAARAYLARVYMYQIGVDPECDVTWQHVYDLTDATIKSGEYSLVPNFATIHEPEGENNSESVFEVQFTDSQSDQNVGTGWARFQQNRNTNNAVQGWGFNNPTQNLIDEFDFSNTGDPRLTCTAYGPTLNDGILYGVKQGFSRTDQGTNYMSRKAAEQTPPIYDGGSGGHNVRLMRYADVLLMHAEACYYLGKDGEAKIHLNKVRERARKSTYSKGYKAGLPNEYPTATGVNLPDVTVSGEALRDAIWHERRVELAMESLRTWDLIRQGRYIDLVNKVKCDDRTSGNTSDGEMKFKNFKQNCMSHALKGRNDNTIPVLPLYSSDVTSWKLQQNPNY